jgi:hypothetical protein
MNGADHCQGLRICKTFAIWRATPLSGAITADADVQYGTHFGQGISLAVHLHPGVLHRTSLAKYASAFFALEMK